MKPIFLIATFFGSGLARVAPGTWGSFAALIAAGLIHGLLGIEALCVATVMVFFVGWWASARYLSLTGKTDDPKEIVIDEVAGMWLTLCAMPLMHIGPPEGWMLWLYVASFITFRLFDIFKPWPISWVDRRLKNAFGIMFDDILAALFALATMGALGHAAGAVGLL